MKTTDPNTIAAAFDQLVNKLEHNDIEILNRSAKSRIGIFSLRPGLAVMLLVALSNSTFRSEISHAFLDFVVDLANMLLVAL